MIAGKVVPPKLACLKEVKLNPLFESTIIPVAMRKGQVSRFKFPFRNLVNCLYHGNKQEIEVEFQFMKTSAAFNFKDED